MARASWRGRAPGDKVRRPGGLERDGDCQKWSWLQSGGRCLGRISNPAANASIDVPVSCVTLNNHMSCQQGCFESTIPMNSLRCCHRPLVRSAPLVAWSSVMAIAVAAGPSFLPAQAVTVAALAEVRGLTSGDACQALPTPGLRSALSRARGPDTAATWPSDSVMARDGLTIQPRTDVRVVVARRLGTGTIYLTPDLGSCPSSRAALRERGLPTPQGAASYRFDRETISGGGERMVLTVDHGSTIVEWSRGQLIVYAGARRLEVKGTRFVVIVDRTTNTGAVYVLEGIVALAAQQGLTANAGQTIVMRPTGATLINSPGVAFANDIEHKSRTVWGRPRTVGAANVSRLPWIIGGAVTAVGVGFLVMPDPSPPPRRIPARLTVRIPF